MEKCQGAKEEHSTSPNNNEYAVTEKFHPSTDPAMVPTYSSTGESQQSVDDEHPTGLNLDAAIIEHQQKNGTVSEQPQEVIPNNKTVQ